MSDLVFEKLDRRLRSTESWLDRRSINASGRAAEIGALLRRYLRHCRRDREKWTDRDEAQNAIDKITRATTLMTMLQYLQDRESHA
jgi:hypothetical protein